MQRIAVEYEFAVYSTRDMFASGKHGPVAAISRQEPTRRHRLRIIVEQEVVGNRPHLVDDTYGYVKHHSGALELVRSPLLVTGAESVSNDPTSTARLHPLLHEHAIDRQSLVVCVGGGALQDAMRYAAAPVHLGVRLVRIPTTVPSQNDSEVRVKNSVNAFGTNNFVGTSEAVKDAVIRDEAFQFHDSDGYLPILDGLAEFGEHMGGELTMTLLRGIGDCFEVHHVYEERMLASIDWLRQRDGGR